ncbi:hypothetical protein [Ponticaulis sp.]|uniref:hypothetical protein n=1 Tax=Ponticaulis sp. TaxID=2020902 RepID=UPI000B6F492E|nr:hypothetical protein [Ponticaulis sp.]MAI90269.1 hypothetical protein [Ponticaulis sp.]OUX99911.1 MAG: hypothetical protein CBB65_07495 [Hyphomonadaceae bacterium TMED5]|tara:strand:- start:248360 stop:248632 length:273 start_codon:yes stop_codon:yes gene_type:complete
MEITATAWAAGMASALLYFVLAWPLAKLFSFGRGLFQSFQMKLVAVMIFGAVIAPLAETHAPSIRDNALDLISRSETATSVYNQILFMLT